MGERTVEFADKEGNVLGNVTLPSEFPGDPNLVQIADRFFQASPAYGAEQYFQIDEPLALPESAIVPVSR